MKRDFPESFGERNPSTIYKYGQIKYFKYVIGISAPNFESGKTTYARAIKYLTDAFYKVEINSFAKDIKEIAKSFGWHGEKDAKGRKLLQVIGTECGREYDENIWVKSARDWANEFENNLYEKSILIYDDVRFNNEAEFIRANGGIMIRLANSLFAKKEISSHASEQGIDINLVDYNIMNKKDALVTVVQMKELLRNLQIQTLS